MKGVGERCVALVKGGEVAGFVTGRAMRPRRSAGSSQAAPEESLIWGQAARIDGCSERRIFWRIILPLSKPVLATAALLHFLVAWDDFMAPLLSLTRKSTSTLALALQSYQSQTGGVQWHYLMAASAVTIVPIVVLFFFTQKAFIQGIATTGSRG